MTDDKMAFLRKVAEQQAGPLRDGNMCPVFLTVDRDQDTTAVVLLKGNDPASVRANLGPAARAICGSQESVVELVHVSDTYTLIGAISVRDGVAVKADGTPWEAGDMEYAVKHQTIDARYVGDALSIAHVDAAGRVSMASVAYTRTTIDWEGNTIPMEITFDWEGATVVTEGTDGYLGGNLPDLLREAVTTPKLADHLRAKYEHQGIPEDFLAEDYLLHLAVQQITQETGFEVLTARCSH